MKIILMIILFVGHAFQSFSDETAADMFISTIAKHDVIQYTQGIKSWTNEEGIVYWTGVKLEDDTVKAIYRKFKDTVPSPPPPAYIKYTIENGEETLSKTVELGQNLHNLFLAMDEEDFDRYGRLIGFMREVLYVDSVHIPLAIKGDGSRDIYWYETHNAGVRLVDREYLKNFKQITNSNNQPRLL